MSEAGVYWHWTYDDVLGALRALGVATASQTQLYLEERATLASNNAAKKRRRWLWQALLNMANDGKVDYWIEPNGVYIWQAKNTTGGRPC